MSESTQETREVPEGFTKVQLGPKFEVVPNDWEIKPLSNWLSNLESGGRPKTSKRSESDSVLSIGGAHISDESFDLDDPVRISEAYYEGLNSGKIEEGDILLVKDGATIGKSTYVNEVPEGRAAVNSHVYILRVGHKPYDPQFLYNFIKSRVGLDQILRLKTGTAQAGLNRTFQQATKVLTPPLPEQRRIADVLSSVDEQIQQTGEIIEKTKELKRGLMQDLFTGGLNNNKLMSVRLGAKTRKIPQHWEVIRLGEISDIKRGASPRPIGDDKYFGGDVGWIRISDITQTDSKYVTEPSDRLSDLGVSESVLIEPETLVLSISATIGKPAILQTKSCIHDGIVALRNLRENVDIEYIYYTLQDLQPRIQAQNQRAAGHQTNVNSKVVRQSEIPLPPLSEQRKIAEMLGTVDSKLEDEKNQLNALKDLKRALMQDLLTGKVRVNTD